MSRIDSQFLDAIRAACQVSVYVAKAGIQLIRSGNEYKALCPFHNDHDPCLTINDEKRFCHCFACGYHGDVISFVFNSRKIPFRDAVSALAADSGLDVPKNGKTQQQASRRGYKPVQFQPSDPPRAMLKWFASRGIPESVILRNQITMKKRWMPQRGAEVPALCFPLCAVGV